jgi:hypothetical protein
LTLRCARSSFSATIEHQVVTSEKKRPNEFKRYRQLLAAIYVGLAGAILVLLTASVIKELLFHTPAVELPASSISADNTDPRDLLECNDLVLEQLTNLSETTNQLLAAPLQADRRSIASSWKNFSTQWRDQWDVIDARCRFSELAGTNMGVAYDRMAQVHEELPAMRLKFQGLIASFDEEQADELSEMRRALDRSRKAITRSIESQSLPARHDANGEVMP